MLLGICPTFNFLQFLKFDPINKQLTPLFIKVHLVHLLDSLLVMASGELSLNGIRSTTHRANLTTIHLGGKNDSENSRGVIKLPGCL